MLSTIIFPIGSLLFVILLLAVYKIKTKQTTVENKLYSLLLIFLAIILVTEIISVFTIYNHNTIPIINEVVCRSHCIALLSWVIIIGLYLISLDQDYDVDGFKNYIKKQKEVKRVLFIYLILCILSFFLKLDYIIVGETAYLGGPCLYYVYGIGVFVIGISIYYVFRQQKNINFLKKLPIIISIVETFITVPLSLKFPTVYIMTSSFTFKMFLIYFMTENPDLYVIKDLKKTKIMTEELSRTKSEFLSNMSNEIKNPMNTIIGISESLANKSTFDKEEDVKLVEHIYSASNSLLEIVNNILDLSKISTSSEGVTNSEYDLKQILAELNSIIGARVKEKVQFNIILDENMPSHYIGDKVKLFQILLNILSNSVKYTEVGKINLEIVFEEHEKDSTLTFKISDTGTGIKEEDYNKLFAKFSRLDNATKNEIEGVGLGLVITKKLVDLLKGEIWFDSKFGAGTNFYVKINQKVSKNDAIGSIVENKKTNVDYEYIDCSKYNVLLVDDNKLNLKVAEKLLKPYNFNITSVTSGKECIYNVKSGEIYDIIFLDHMMPGMDGIEVLHILKKSAKNFNIPPIIALTANAITGMKEMYLKEGFDDYIAKPINVSDLNKLILKYFDKEEK